jgi:hypothetical protein
MLVMSRLWNVILRLAFIYLIAGAICFAFSHTLMALLYPAIGIAMALAIVFAIVAVACILTYLIIWIGRAAASRAPLARS